jgi:hypothetical protein
MRESWTGDDKGQEARAAKKPYAPPRLHQLDDKSTEGKPSAFSIEAVPTFIGPS